MDSCSRVATSLSTTYLMAKAKYAHGGCSQFSQALACCLIAPDWRSLVLLGNPTVKFRWTNKSGLHFAAHQRKHVVNPNISYESP